MSEEMSFENVDERTTDACLYYKLRGGGGSSGYKLQVNKIADHKSPSHALKFGKHEQIEENKNRLYYY